MDKHTPEQRRKTRWLSKMRIPKLNACYGKNYGVADSGTAKIHKIIECGVEIISEDTFVERYMATSV